MSGARFRQSVMSASEAEFHRERWAWPASPLACSMCNCSFERSAAFLVSLSSAARFLISDLHSSQDEPFVKVFCRSSIEVMRSVHSFASFASKNPFSVIFFTMALSLSSSAALIGSGGASRGSGWRTAIEQG